MSVREMTKMMRKRKMMQVGSVVLLNCWDQVSQ